MPDCPSCRSSMRLVIERGIEIDVCDGCHGVWLDRGELARLTNEATLHEGAFSDPTLAHQRCPVCRTVSLLRIIRPTGSYAMCGTCEGIFIDGATLDLVSASVLDSSGNKGLQRTADVISGVTGHMEFFVWVMQLFSL